MRTKVMLSNVSKQTAEPLCRRVTLTFACYRIFFGSDKISSPCFGYLPGNEPI